MSGTTIATRCTCLTQRTISFITILMAISLSILSASAIEFSFDAPDSVDEDEEFEVSITSSENVNEDYDVKIFVHESKEYEIPRSTYISEIFNEDKDKWSDPWYYIKKSYPDEDKYEIKVIDSEGDQTLCVRLRQSEDNEDGHFDEKCEKITIGESKKKSEKNSDDDKDEESEKEKRSDLVYYSNSQEVPPGPAQVAQPAFPVEKEIKLSAPKKQNSKEIETPDSKKRNYIVYSFFGFLLILVILLALKKL